MIIVIEIKIGQDIRIFRIMLCGVVHALVSHIVRENVATE